MIPIRHAYILAGGQSIRFGSPKAWVQIDGVPLITSLCQQLELDLLKPTIVAQDLFAFASLPWRSIADLVPQSGPLAGVEAALVDCKKHGELWCWILTCDLIRWQRHWNQQLKANDVDSACSETAAILLDDGKAFLPFPGVYSVTALSSLREAWVAGDRSLRSWHNRIQSRIKKISIPTETFPKTFNTPQELAELCSQISTHPLRQEENSAS